MRSNYKKLGQYIRSIDIRNKADKKDNLLGVSTQKVFIESIANTIGTDFTKYKVVRRKQFTYVPDTSRRGDKIGLAMLEHLDEGMVSPVYTVFEIIDQEQLDPEYLMMWFRRPEFDRYARYMSHGSVREIFGWEEMCDVELPIPSIEKQKEVVREYNTIVNRIKLNEQLNQELEKVAQAIYKHWFVDFEFPISTEYAKAIGKHELEGMPYKSSHGEMVFCEELDQEIPKGWIVKPLSEVSDYLNRGVIPKYTDSDGIMVINQKCIRNNTINYTLARKHVHHNKSVSEEKFLRKFDILVNSTGAGTLGRVGLVKEVKEKMVVDTHITIVRPVKTLNQMYFWFYLSSKTTDIENLAEGTTGQTELSRDNLGSIQILIPIDSVQKAFSELTINIVKYSFQIDSSTPLLKEFSSLLLQSISKV